MRAVIACVALALCACSTGPRDGTPTGRVVPQAKEQCEAQQGLDWCHERR